MLLDQTSSPSASPSSITDESRSHGQEESSEDGLGWSWWMARFIQRLPLNEGRFPGMADVNQTFFVLEQHHRLLSSIREEICPSRGMTTVGSKNKIRQGAGRSWRMLESDSAWNETHVESGNYCPQTCWCLCRKNALLRGRVPEGGRMPLALPPIFRIILKFRFTDKYFYFGTKTLSFKHSISPWKWSRREVVIRLTNDGINSIAVSAPLMRWVQNWARKVLKRAN